MSASTKDKVEGNVELRTPSRTAYAYASDTHPEVLDAQARDIFWCLVAFRIINALTISTFFQPDEYYQSLEPAWATVFGSDSGAWITWEWQNQLRSSLHPLLFATVYYLSSALSFAIDLSPPLRAELLIAAPKVTQAVLAALTDYFTWKLGERLYGRGSSTAWATLFLTVLSPWQWFCSTRTFSNNLETTLTILAIHIWPWHWSSDKLINDTTNKNGLRTGQENGRSLNETVKLRRALFLASCASLIRPTNGLIWLCISAATLQRASAPERSALFRESVTCGFTMVALESFLDQWFYKSWTFPPLRFIYYNVVQNISVFYGTSRVDYYLTEGLPLLLTTTLPFAMAGIWQALRLARRGVPPNHPSFEASKVKISHIMLRTLALTSCILPICLSFLSHKEVRFIYPLLPVLHVLAAKPFASFYDPFPTSSIAWRKVLLLTTILLNFLIAGYSGHIHQRGVLDVIRLLRREHQQVLYDMTVEGELDAAKFPNITVGFFMPCHSTPWRSHLVHPTVHAWALTCEPPLDIPLSGRHLYLDEADKFYQNPQQWIEANMEPVDNMQNEPKNAENRVAHRRKWPDYVVFFEQLEPMMNSSITGQYYSQYWRGFNSHWHDDWRRRGDVVVWRRADAKAP